MDDFQWSGATQIQKDKILILRFIRGNRCYDAVKEHKEEIVNDVLEAISRIKITPNDRDSYICKITINKINKRMRDVYKKREFETPLEENQTLIYGVRSLEDELIEDQLKEHFEWCMKMLSNPNNSVKLTKTEKLTIELYIEGYDSVSKIANVRGVSYHAVYNAFHKAIEKLGECIDGL